jgi:hypothetical protein
MDMATWKEVWRCESGADKESRNREPVHNGRTLRLAQAVIIFREAMAHLERSARWVSRRLAAD